MDQPTASMPKFPYDFFLLTFALAVPLYLVGEQPLPLPVKLPTSALIVVAPMTSAAILSSRRGGWQAVRRLFTRGFDYPRIQQKVWYLPILFFNPLVMLLSYAVMRVARIPLPEPNIPPLAVPGFFVLFFITALGEELGWMGYAFDPMEKRLGALRAGALLGAAWALFHIIPDLQNQQPAGWIFWHRLNTIITRILMVWLYRRTNRSVFGSVLFHAMNNVSWALFPNFGSHYNPFITTLVTLAAFAAVLLRWKPNKSRRALAAR